MMLGRKLLANAAPAATRSFRAAAVSMKMPTTEAEMDAYLAQPGNADLTADQIIAKLNAENPVASPASSGPDIVKEVFFDQQRKFRAFADKTKDLVPPVGGDDAAIEAYATKRNAVLKELGIRTPEESIEATMKAGMNSGMSAKEYLAFAASQRLAMGIEDAGGLGKALDAALAATEKEMGKTLMVNDATGMKALYAKVEGIVGGLGLGGDVAKASMIEETKYEMEQLKSEQEKFA